LKAADLTYSPAFDVPTGWPHSNLCCACAVGADVGADVVVQSSAKKKR